MVVTMMRQDSDCAELVSRLAGLLADARTPLNFPRTAKAYGWGPCVLNTWYAFTCSRQSSSPGPIYCQ